MRKQIIQQLLAGDLADLADEGIYQLLPMVPEKARAGKKGKDFKRQHSWTQTRPKQQWMKPKVRGGTDLVPSLWNKMQDSRHVGKAGLTMDTLCYVSLEQEVIRQLKRSHTQRRLVQALREVVFPELNLKSYLECKSDLALSTIRKILHGRPTDNTFELDRSLTKASMGQRRSSTATKKVIPLNKNAVLSPANVPRKSHRQTHPHPWLPPMEWED